MGCKLLAGLLSFAMIATSPQMQDVQIFAETAETADGLVTGTAGSVGKSEALTDRALAAIDLSGNKGVGTDGTYVGGAASGVYLSWRSFHEDYNAATGRLDTTFTLYKDGEILVSDLSATNYLDVQGTSASTYKIVGSNDAAIGLNSERTEQGAKPWADYYYEFDLCVPNDGESPESSGENTGDSSDKADDAEVSSTDTAYTYSANDMSVGDLDGDGELELIVKWYPSNAKDNSQFGYTGKTYLDGYDINFADGTAKLLWRIDMGINIRSGAHYTQYQVWDYDGDGKAEIAVKTSDGTASYQSNDGTDQNMTRVAFVGAEAALSVDEKSTGSEYDYRNTGGHVITGNEYFSIFNGEDGSKAAPDVAYLPARGSVSDWGDGHGNRSERYLSGTAYLDGQHPYAIFTRGYYARTGITAYYMEDANHDGVGDTIKVYWVFDTKEAGDTWAGQGNHGLSINDVDGDGKDEVVFASLTLDDDGTPMYTTGLEHGDALHVSDWVPWNDGLEIMCVHEHEGVDYHVEVHDAKTGKLLMGYFNGKDTGRGVMADIDPTAEGGEWWAAYDPDGSRGSIYSAWSTMGNLVKLADTTPSQNFSIFWDGDLLSETLDGNFDSKNYVPVSVKIEKWNYLEEKSDPLFVSSEIWTNNGTKSNVGLCADILGDWREEIIARVEDADGTKSEKIRIYMTTIPTDYTVPCLLEDRAYREGVAWQNVGYNQPANPSYLLSEGLVTAQLSTKEPKEDAVQLLFTPASDGKYGHEITAYEIYRTDSNGTEKKITVKPEELNTEIPEQSTAGSETVTVQSTEYYSEDFEGSEHSFTVTDTRYSDFASCAADKATVYNNTSGKIYGVGAGGGDTGAQVNLSGLGITGTANVSLDLRMDACGYGKGSSFALLGTPNSAGFLSSSSQILTISAATKDDKNSGNGNWESIKLNGIDITNKANRDGSKGESGSNLQRNTTGWMHLDATLHFDSQTVDVVLKHKATGAEIYSGTIDFVNKGNMALTALKSIFIAGGRQYGGVYIDDITVTGTPEAPVESVTPHVDFYYVYQDTDVEKDKVYSYKVAAVVDGKTSFLSRPLEITTILKDYIVQCDTVKLEVEKGSALDVSGIETVNVTRLSGKTEELAIQWLDTTVDTTNTGTAKVGYMLEGEEGIRYAEVDIVNPAVYKFDFGITPAGNTAEGWTEIVVNSSSGKKTNAELGIAYRAEKGYGFVDEAGTGIINGRQESYIMPEITGGLPKAVYQDYFLAGGQTFAVDLPNGDYEVTMVNGSTSNDRLEAQIEGASVSGFRNTRGQYAMKTYSVTLTDGQLDMVLSSGRVDAIIIRKVTAGAAGAIAVSGVALSKDALTFETAETQTIYGTVVPVNADSKDLEWTSDDESIATIAIADDGGVVVTPRKNGTATITAAAKGDSAKTKTCTVTVNNPDWVTKKPVTGIQVSPASVALTVGATQELTYTVLPENATNKEVDWISGDTEKATVADVDGKIIVTAVSTGTVTVTAKAKDGSDITGTCEITITNSQTEDSGGSETGNPNGSESENPNGSESENPNGSESENPNGSESENPNGSESENPNGSESENPNGSESENPNGSESENPNGSESENPNGSESENPDGSESENPNGSESGGVGNSETGGTESSETTGDSESGSEKPNLTEEQKKQVNKITDQLGVSEETAIKIQAVGEQYKVPEDTLLIGDKTITGQKSDADIKGSSFALLQARAVKITKNQIQLKWTKVKGADGYLIYGNKCGKANKLKLLKTIKKGSATSYTQKKLNKGTFYKYIVRAYKVVDGQKVTLAASKTIHIVTKGGKNVNERSVNVNKTKVSLKKGKSFTIKASAVKGPKKPHRKIAYESTDPKVAKVSAKGKITAVGKGKCTVYVYSQSGLFKKITVTVK